MNVSEIQARNTQVISQLTSDDSSIYKEAAGDVNQYLRLRSREDGFLRRILPPETATPADFDRQAHTVKPAIVKDAEPNTPNAYSVPFGNAPKNSYIKAPRYMITFERIMTDRFQADVADLMTYTMDIRQIFNDLMLKDILDEEDRKFITTVNGIVGAENDTNPVTNPRLESTGAMGNVSVGVMSRSSISHAQKGLGSTDNSLNPACSLINNITIWDYVGLPREQIGGDLAEELMVNGFKEREIMGTKWFITIKKDLVPNDIMYYFAAPEFMGDFYTVEDVTVSTKHENYMFEMFAYEMIGAAVKNEASVAKVRFGGTKTEWRP